MSIKATITSHDDENWNVDWGVQSETYVYRSAEDTNYSSTSDLLVGDDNTGGDPDYNTVFTITMPEKPTDGAEIYDMAISLVPWNYESLAGASNSLTITLFKLDNPYTDGEVTWRERKTGVEWDEGGGDFSEEKTDAIDGRVITMRAVRTYNQYTTTHLSWNMKDDLLDWGDTGQYILSNRLSGVDTEWWIYFRANDASYTTIRPKLWIYYTIPEPDGFDSATDKLKIEPNPADKTQAKLTWGGSDNPSFKNYKIYRRAAANEALSTTLTTITDAGNTEYIDSLSTTTDAKYYYQASISIEDDYSNIVSTLSTEVEFWRPKVTTFTVTSTTPDAWSLVTGTITGSVTNKPAARTTTKYIYDWEGDASAEQIRNLTTHAATDNTTHAYTSAGARTPRAKIEDNKGFQSDYTSASAVTVAGLSPIAIIKGPTYCAKGTAYYFRADESYDQNSDGSITSYAWDYSRITSFTSNLTTSDPVASVTWSYTGTKTLSMKARDDDSNQSESVNWTVVVYDDSPTVLDFDEDVVAISAVNANNGEALFAENLWLGKGGSETRGELVWTGQDFPNVSLRGWTMDADGRDVIDTLLGYNDTPTKLKVWVTLDKLWLIGYMSNLEYDIKAGEIDQYYFTCDFVCEGKVNGS